MSITIEDALKLPSLRTSKVLGGIAGLDKIILTISVLECSEYTEQLSHVYNNLNYAGGELVITSLYNVRNDVEKQLDCIRNIVNVGVIGCILYYVGLILPEVDEKLIQLANELDFPLICMPESDPRLRYSEVISEVSELIIRDQMKDDNYSLELMTQMSKLPVAQRTVDSMLYLVGTRLHATIVLTDANNKILNISTWPRNQFFEWEKMKNLIPKDGKKEIFYSYPTHSLYVYHSVLKADLYYHYNLYVFSESKVIENRLWKQAVDGIFLGMNLWGQDHAKMGMRELVRAIIRDEPIKMRRIADIYNINMSEINDMVILHCIRNESLTSFIDEVRILSSSFVNIRICELFENDILIFYTGQPSLTDLDKWSFTLENSFFERGIAVTITRCNCLRNTADVKNAYYSNQAYIHDAKTVFPNRAVFSLAEIEFVKNCRMIVDSGEEHIDKYILSLRNFLDTKDGDDMLETLTSFFLDNKSSITETAKTLFVHKNTIKYRLQKAGSMMGFRIGEMPGSQNLLYALAILRILQR